MFSTYQYLVMSLISPPPFLISQKLASRTNRGVEERSARDEETAKEKEVDAERILREKAAKYESLKRGEGEGKEEREGGDEGYLVDFGLKRVEERKSSLPDSSPGQGRHHLSLSLVQ